MTNKTKTKTKTNPKNRTYCVAGDVRGVISYHRELSAAQRSLDDDHGACAAQSGYSDANIFRWVDGVGYKCVDSEELGMYDPDR